MKVWQSYLENKTSGSNENVLGLRSRSERYYNYRFGATLRR